MIAVHKNRFKPLYKQFINLYENVQNRKKILQFKKQKWKKLISYIRHKSKKYKKYKPYSQMGYIITKYPTKWNSYKKNHKKILQACKKFKLLYGSLNENKMKNLKIKAFKIKNNLNLFFLELFEKRLDVILYRAKFSTSIRNAKQLISHGKIFVNYKKINSQSYNLKSGDIISIDYKFKLLIEQNIANSEIWPIPPKHLIINYKTLQIIFGNLDNSTFASQFNYNLNLEKVLIGF
jgi:ribosomal protein S4